jgi:hypothetical protein
VEEHGKYMSKESENIAFYETSARLDKDNDCFRGISYLERANNFRIMSLTFPSPPISLKKCPQLVIFLACKFLGL